MHSESGGWDESPHPVTGTRTARVLLQPHISAVLRSGPRRERHEAAGMGAGTAGATAAALRAQTPYGSSTRNPGREGGRAPTRTQPHARGLALTPPRRQLPLIPALRWGGCVCGHVCLRSTAATRSLAWPHRVPTADSCVSFREVTPLRGAFGSRVNHWPCGRPSPCRRQGLLAT